MSWFFWLDILWHAGSLVSQDKVLTSNPLLQLFKEDPDTGLTHVALSSDSTCTNHLYSSQDGYETLHLEKLEPPPPPTTTTTIEAPSEPTCYFPEWMQGKWENLQISGGELTYRDETNFVTYRGKCLESIDDSDAGSNGLRYLLHLTTDCGAPSLNCALFHRRDSNVMEFQLGKDHHLSFFICHLESWMQNLFSGKRRLQPFFTKDDKVLFSALNLHSVSHGVIGNDT